MQSYAKDTVSIFIPRSFWRAILSTISFFLRPLFAHLYLRTRTMNLTTAATDVDIADLDLSGFVLAAAQELATDTDPVVSDALNLLLQLHNEV